MDNYVTNRILVALLVGSLCLMGYTVTYARGDTVPVEGKMVIAAGIPIRQGDQVEYTFLEDTALDKLELTNTYIELDDEIRFGAHVEGAGHLNVSIRSWEPSADSGRVIQWNASSASDVIVTFTVYSPQFRTDLVYQVLVDGVESASLEFDASRETSFAWGIWSDHLFELTIPESSDDSDDGDDDTDGGIIRPPIVPWNPTGLDPYAWLVVVVALSSVVLIGLLMLSRSGKGRRGRPRS